MTVHSSNTIEFADDATVVGLIVGGDEAAYWDEIQRLLSWCSVNSLNAIKTKELIFDFK